jgi:hypothetical protein
MAAIFLNLVKGMLEEFPQYPTWPPLRTPTPSQRDLVNLPDSRGFRVDIARMARLYATIDRSQRD